MRKNKMYEEFDGRFFELERDFHYTTNYLENKIAQLERFIISSGLAEKYEESAEEALFKFGGNVYQIAEK